MSAAVTLPAPKALLFDFMGTCLDWRSNVYEGLRQHLDDAPAMDMANAWRQEYFLENGRRTDAGLAPEDFDVTLRRVLDRLLEQRELSFERVSDEARQELIKRWHSQRAWPDMTPALDRLQKHFDTIVHANGTTRLQIDIMRSSGLKFHAVVSSELLGVSKPAHENYLKAARLFKLKPEECLTVAAHAYDVRGAKEVGMQTAYIWREKEDQMDDVETLQGDFDYFVDGRGGGIDTGLGKLADILLSKYGM